MSDNITYKELLDLNKKLYKTRTDQNKYNLNYHILYFTKISDCNRYIYGDGVENNKMAGFGISGAYNYGDNQHDCSLYTYMIWFKKNDKFIEGNLCNY